MKTTKVEIVNSYVTAFCDLCKVVQAVMASNCEKYFTSNLESSKISADMKNFLVAKLDTSRNSGGVSVVVGVGIK